MNPRRKHKPWSTRDDTLLREHYPALRTVEVASLLKRTLSSVYVRASQLKLKKSAAALASMIATSTRNTRPAGVHLNGYNRWGKPALATLKKLYPQTPTTAIAERLGRRVSQVYAMAGKLGLKKDPAITRETLRQSMLRADHPGRKHQFAKGSIPPNKGAKGWDAGGRSVLTRFKPGQRPRNTKPVGSLRIDSSGLLSVKINDTGYGPHDWRPLHQLAWELKHGPIPPAHIVTFADGNKRHFSDDNLQLLSKADNVRRNSIHRLPKALVQVIQLKGALKRQINRRTKDEQQHRKSA